MHSQHASKKPLLTLGAAALLVTLALWSIYFHHSLTAQTPSVGDWQAAAGLIQEQAKPQDAVAVVPFWATTGEQAFVEAGLVPHYVRRVSQEDWPNVSRLWVVSSHDRFTDRADFIEQGAIPVKRYFAGPIEIELLALPKPSPAFDFVQHLAEADVYTTRNGKTTTCLPFVPEEKRFRCSPRLNWHYVGVLPMEIGDARRETIWAHPVTGTKIHIVFERVPASQQLVLRHGLTLYAVAEPKGKPVYIDVLVDGRKLGQVLQPNTSGWLRSEFDLSEISGDVHRIELVVHSPHDGRRHFTFTGFAK